MISWCDWEDVSQRLAIKRCTLRWPMMELSYWSGPLPRHWKSRAVVSPEKDGMVMQTIMDSSKGLKFRLSKRSRGYPSKNEGK